MTMHVNGAVVLGFRLTVESDWQIRRDPAAVYPQEADLELGPEGHEDGPILMTVASAPEES